MTNFKKITRNKPFENSAQEDWLHALIKSVHQQVAAFLNRKAAGWPAKKVKVALILFCLVSGNVCLYTIGRAILSDNGPPQIIQKIKRLDIPATMSGKQLKEFRPTDTTKNH